MGTYNTYVPNDFSNYYQNDLSIYNFNNNGKYLFIHALGLFCLVRKKKRKKEEK